MAPVTRLEALSTNGTKFSHNKVMRRSKEVPNLRLVHCTVHLDQLNNDGQLKTMPKMKQSMEVNSEGRLVHPLIFKSFSPDKLNESSSDGNVCFVMELETLLSRFSHGHYVRKSAHFLRSHEILLTRGKRNVDRYSEQICLPFRGSVVSAFDHLEAEINRLFEDSSPENFKLYVDVVPSDLKFLKKNWVREFVNHENCKERGDLCTNLMNRDVAWDASNF